MLLLKSTVEFFFLLEPLVSRKDFTFVPHFVYRKTGIIKESNSNRHIINMFEMTVQIGENKINLKNILLYSNCTWIVSDFKMPSFSLPLIMADRP